jgi:hypothetical protein
MPLVPPGITVALATAQGLLSPIIVRQRNIGGFVASVTLEEIGTDRTEITRHPIEQGAAITDHAYLHPPELIVRPGWSNSDLAGLGDPNYVQEIYKKFLALMGTRQPFTVVTGKRVYKDMLIEEITVPTDVATENSFKPTIRMRNVILVRTQTASLPSPDVMKSPGATAPDSPQGTKQLGPAPNVNTLAAPSVGEFS